MNVKIDTKEKFTVITPNEGIVPANMTGEMADLLLSYLNNAIPHVVLNMKNVQMVDQKAGEKIASVQRQFYEKNCSFVVCELNEEIQHLLEEAGILDGMNITPTESEAWDIVQMEEVERELLKDFDDAENI